jgi:hypothetical protein
MAPVAPTVMADGASPMPPGPVVETPRRNRVFGRALNRATPGDLRLYQHSNLLYWWVVWAYGFVCAGLTYVQGVGVSQLAASADKASLFHPSPWLGISFVALVLFVAIFTNVRARGIYSFVLIMVVAGVAWGATHLPSIGTALNWASLLRIHLNLAFYLTFSALLMLLWLFAVVFIDHFTWWRFSPGQVVEEHRIGQATGHAYNTEGMVVRRLPDDFFRHRILGLGTGDFTVKPPYEDSFEILNVWKANRKQRVIERMVATGSRNRRSRGPDGPSSRSRGEAPVKIGLLGEAWRS